MKITLTSSIGNIGKPLAQQLIKEGHKVTIISHTASRQAEIKAMNAIPKIGSLQDTDFLIAAFQQADAVFLMNPPDYSQVDIRSYYRQTSNNYATAIQKTKIPRVVLLSSFGAHLNHATGPILGSHFAEEIIKRVPNNSLTTLRPTYFYYNLFNYIDMIKYTGKIMANYDEEKFPLISPKDIATVAAAELIKTESDFIRYVTSSEHTGQEIATCLGKAIGKPNLQWVIVAAEEVKRGMTQNGVPAKIATLFTEMYQSLAMGRLTEDYNIWKSSEIGAVSLADFAKDFAQKYHQ